MHTRLHGKSLLTSLLAVTVGALFVTGCTSGTMSGSNSNSTSPTGASFVIGTDAPMASVTSFSVQITGMQAFTSSDCSGTGVSLISGSPTVDFARFNGLQTLLDMNDVTAGTYNCVSVSFGTATIGYLNTSGGGEPALQTEPATLTTTSVNAPLANPMQVAENGAPVGVHFDFDLRKSIQVDSNGQITGTVDPTFNIKAVNNSDPGAYIDEFDAAVLSVDTATDSFTIQGPHGRQFTVNTNGETEWDGSATLSSLSTSSIVQVSGNLDRADRTIDADEVAILSQNGFYAAGQVTYVNPSSGPANSFDLYVRGTLPTGTGVVDGNIATIDLTGSEKYSIYWMHGPLAQFLFNPSGLLAGQHVAVGGPASGAANGSAVTVNRVVLRDWGFNGTVVPGSENAGNDTFQMQINGFAGVLIPETVTVYITDKTVFRDGWSSMADITDNANVRVVGLLLKDPTSGKAVLVGHYCDDLD
ncbi:MAG TPA: DUF4382 domain-containing protein [Terracidiphilus sp.]|jgi:hypothetical protein|nr:DUF4382 domain-containing protein [Terracidiphilus sp.]